MFQMFLSRNERTLSVFAQLELKKVFFWGLFHSEEEIHLLKWWPQVWNYD